MGWRWDRIPCRAAHPALPELQRKPVQERCDHTLLDIVAITLLASMCGADDWPEVEVFACQTREPWLRTFLELPQRCIHFARHLGRVVRSVGASAIRGGLLFLWTRAFATRPRRDGHPPSTKTARRSFVQENRELGALHLNHRVGRRKAGSDAGPKWPVPRSPTRSRAIPELLKCSYHRLHSPPLMRWALERNRGAGYRATRAKYCWV